MAKSGPELARVTKSCPDWHRVAYSGPEKTKVDQSSTRVARSIPEWLRKAHIGPLWPKVQQSGLEFPRGAQNGSEVTRGA